MSDRLSFVEWKQRVDASGYQPGCLPRRDLGILPSWAVVTAPFPQSSGFRASTWCADAGVAGRLEVGLWTHRPHSRIPRGMGARWALVLLCRGVSGRSCLDLDHSVGEVMYLTGGNLSGGARSGRRGLRQGVRDILDCGISFTKNGECRNVSPVLGLKDEGAGLDPLKLRITRLNRLFVRSVEKGVPVDLRALRLLGRDALAWDLLVYTAWRVRSVEEPLVVRWSWLGNQLGSRMRDAKSFRKRLRRAFAKVRVLYPALDAEPVAEGIELRPSPPMFEIHP